CQFSLFLMHLPPCPRFPGRYHTHFSALPHQSPLLSDPRTDLLMMFPWSRALQWIRHLPLYCRCRRSLHSLHHPLLPILRLPRSQNHLLSSLPLLLLLPQSSLRLFPPDHPLPPSSHPRRRMLPGTKHRPALPGTTSS